LEIEGRKSLDASPTGLRPDLIGKLYEAVNMKFVAPEMRRQGKSQTRLGPVLAAIVLVALAGCNFSLGGEAKYPVNRQPGQNVPVYEEEPGLLGEGGLFGNPNASQSDTGGGIGVNNLLWRASLDTISFMPLVSADPFGGVIISDWYTPPQSPDERFKVNIYILGRALRADGIRAAVFRQQLQGSVWLDAPVALNTATDLENAILTRARQLRISGNQ
jgi:hypothetical protein